MVILEHIILIVGVLTYIASIVMYVKRSGDYKSLIYFWSAKMVLIPIEFKVRRAGILIMVVGIGIRIYNQLFA